MSAPAHLVVPGTERHGVTVLARQLATATGAEVVEGLDAAAERPHVHVHATDRLLGADPEQARAALVDLGRRTRVTATWHDVPQPGDGAGFERRRACYAGWLDAVSGWLVSSRTERATVERWCEPATAGGVVPLPVWPPAPGVPGLPAGPVEPGAASLGLFGWVYPGKGHADVLAAAALLGHSPDTRPRVVAVGAVAAGHDDLARRLAERAEVLGVRFEITGWLPDDAVALRLADLTVAVAGHLNVSASGSVNSWTTAGRRPLVRASDYAREMAELRPGTLELYDDRTGPTELARLVERRLAQPALGVLDPDAVLRPTLAEVAAEHHRWWADQ